MDVYYEGGAGVAVLRVVGEGGAIPEEEEGLRCEDYGVEYVLIARKVAIERAAGRESVSVSVSVSVWGGDMFGSGNRCWASALSALMLS